jgi:hypothetical protein
MGGREADDRSHGSEGSGNQAHDLKVQYRRVSIQAAKQDIYICDWDIVHGSNEGSLFIIPKVSMVSM